MPVGEAREPVSIPPGGSIRLGVEELLGRFVDVSWSYRFGPPAQHAVVASLEREDEWDGRPISQALRFPAGRPSAAESSDRLGLEGEVEPGEGGLLLLRLRSRRLAYGVRVHVPGFEPDDDALFVEPGRERVIRLGPRGADATFAGGELGAVNLGGRVRLPAGPASADRVPAGGEATIES